jgi:hypothetical protein
LENRKAIRHATCQSPGKQHSVPYSTADRFRYDHAHLAVLTRAEKILSCFIDEAGDFGEYETPSPYYLVSVAAHEQSNDQDIPTLWRMFGTDILPPASGQGMPPDPLSGCLEIRDQT